MHIQTFLEPIRLMPARLEGEHPAIGDPLRQVQKHLPDMQRNPR